MSTKPKSTKPKSTKPGPDLLNHPLLWRGKDLLNNSGVRHTGPTLPSGHPELDSQFQGGGWPQQGLVDLLLPHAGIGELRLILPILETLTQTRFVVWINPPFIPHASALNAFGVNPRNQLVVQTRTHEDALWSMERCCLSQGCAAVLAWPEERKLNIKETRRVQLAARSGQTLAIFFRPIDAVERSSLAELRLALRPTDCVDQLAVDIVKRKGGWPVQNIRLGLNSAGDQARYQSCYQVMEPLHQQLALWQKVALQQEQAQEQQAKYAKESEGLSTDFVYDFSQTEPDALPSSSLPADSLPSKPLGGLH